MTIEALPQMEKIDEMDFASRASFARFSDDGKQLFVLTEDQAAYTIAVRDRWPASAIGPVNS